MEALAAWSDFLKARERFDEERTTDAEEAMVAAWRAFCEEFDAASVEESVAALQATIERERAA